MKLYSVLFYTLIVLFFGVAQARPDIQIKMNCNDDEMDGNCIAAGRIEYIYLFNKIKLSDFEKLSYVAGQLPINLPFPLVLLNSDGADLDAAIGIGRILRWRIASVETYDISNPENKSKCYSGCVLIAAGAVNRKLSMIGLHSGYMKFEGPDDDISLYHPISDETKERIASYYTEMGISRELQEQEKATPFWEMRYFFYNHDLPRDIQKIVQWGFR
jgi:hypothetical protein